METPGDWTDSDTPTERWAPLGAVADSPSQTSSEGSKSENVDSLLDENEKMANSLLSLTSHFAQVQFRLKQIIEGPEESKVERLKELEQFAEKGIPDLKSCMVPADSQTTDDGDEEYKKKLSGKQKIMISELKSSLADLETYAYENGLAEELPTSKMMEKQEIIIQEIKRKLQISHLDNLASLSSAELRECVDEAIGQIVNPAKVKEKQVEQLQTQVVDLERFVDFLQAEVTSAQQEAQAKASRHSRTRYFPPNVTHLTPPSTASATDAVRTQGTGSSDKTDERVEDGFMYRVKQVITVIQLFIISELGCASRQSELKRNEMKEKASEPHYGDLLAEMQMSVDVLIDTAERVIRDRGNTGFTDCDYLSDEEAYISESKELTKCVRKRFTAALKNLIEHGASESCNSQALLPFSGCSPRTTVVVVKPKTVHAWEIILKYYKIKDGQAFNEMPSQKLANAFGLDDHGTSDSTVKQTLLSAIGHIIETHTRYQRSDDSHFKAFVCLALNEKKLVPWLRQIFRTSALVDYYYRPWSYLAKTGFEDIFCAMNKLKLYDFNLPVNLAVKQFSDIKDAF